MPRSKRSPQKAPPLIAPQKLRPCKANAAREKRATRRHAAEDLVDELRHGFRELEGPKLHSSSLPASRSTVVL